MEYAISLEEVPEIVGFEVVQPEIAPLDSGESGIEGGLLQSAARSKPKSPAYRRAFFGYKSSRKT
jgi:hypothetical protein